MVNFSYLIVLVLAFIMFMKSSSIGEIFGVMSYPDKLRKFHNKSVAQVGGIIFFLSLVFLGILNYQDIDQILNDFTQSITLKKMIFFLSFFTLFFLGLIDDRQNLNANTKLLFLLLISYLLLISLSQQLIYLKFSFYKNIDLFEYKSFFFIFLFIFLINAMNMFDGINLQSSSYFLIIWTYIVAYLGFDLIIASTIIFLVLFSVFNYNNKLFLGDCGVYLLTFFSFVYLLKIYNFQKIVTIDEIVSLLLLPSVDCCRVILIRLLNKQSPFIGDREHFHYKLLQKFSYKVTITLIFFGSIMPIIFYKILNVGFAITIITFFLFYIICLLPKKTTN
jgi:UDP-GlcNAc:undecaprenyl-phosphate/decaprenyl-phosphate GlcNAc-1-phosphate transferase